MERKTLTIALWLLASLWFAAPLLAQKKPKVPRNHPDACPYCKNDPEVMKAAGIVSHGGFEVARKSTEEAAGVVGGAEIYWIETTNFKVGLALGPIKVRQEEKAKIRAECAHLAETLEDVPLKPKTLDPWLRAHLYAVRLEKVYSDMLEFLDADQSKFPEPGTVWNMVGEYWGEGPYMGPKGKLEIMLWPSEGFHSQWLKENFGLLTKKSQRWHIIDTGSLQFSGHTDQGSLSVDEALHGHVVFNVSIMLVNSYKHYSYDMPVWLLEGIGHYMERKLNPKYNTFDSGEGGMAAGTRKEKWEPEVRKLVAKEEAPSLSALVRMSNFAELNLDHHFATWSMVDYLVQAHPGFLPEYIRRISDLRNEELIPDGSTLGEEQRASFKEDLKLSYLQFDRAWADWVMENYSSK